MRKNVNQGSDRQTHKQTDQLLRITNATDMDDRAKQPSLRREQKNVCLTHRMVIRLNLHTAVEWCVK